MILQVFKEEEDSERDAPCTVCGETPQPLCRLALRIFQQAVRKIPCPVHDAFDTKGIAFHVKEQMADKRSFYLDTPNVSEFGGLKVAATPQARPLGNALDRFMHGQQIAFGHVEVGIFQISTVLQGHVLFSPQGNGYFQAHAMEQAF